jgi:hypothetical protein
MIRAVHPVPLRSTRHSRSFRPEPKGPSHDGGGDTLAGGLRQLGAGVADGQYLRLHEDLITMGTDSVCVMVPSLTQNVMVNVEFTARPAGIVVTG